MKRSPIGRIAETTLLWNPLGMEASNADMALAVQKRWLIQGELNPRQWLFYAGNYKKEPFLDVTFMNSCYSYFSYLVNGKTTPLWYVPLGEWRYLPSITSSRMTHLLKGPTRLYAFYLKKDRGGLDITSLMRFKEIDFNVGGDVWHESNLWGAKVEVEMIFNLFQIETGFKTPGDLYLKANSQFSY